MAIRKFNGEKHKILRNDVLTAHGEERNSQIVLYHCIGWFQVVVGQNGRRQNLGGESLEKEVFCTVIDPWPNQIRAGQILGRNTAFLCKRVIGMHHQRKGIIEKL